LKTQLTDRDSIPEVISEMTLEEKVLLLTGSTPFFGGENKEHGIPAPLFLDGGTGFNSGQMMLEALFETTAETDGKYDPEDITEPLGSLGISTSAVSKDAEKQSERDKQIIKRTGEIMNDVRPADRELGCFPPGMFLAATMDPELIEQCGEAVGREACACHIDVLLGAPNVNLHRDPRNGRIFEGYSEDPCVVSKLAPSFVKGVQSAGVAADVKHFACNNQETDRMGVNESIDERTVRELYLPGFRACVEAGCRTVMAAYNQINGKACAENEWLLKKVLRDEWKFKGFVSLFKVALATPCSSTVQIILLITLFLITESKSRKEKSKIEPQNR
jgi:beta-glucosidase